MPRFRWLLTALVLRLSLSSDATAPSAIVCGSTSIVHEVHCVLRNVYVSSRGVATVGGGMADDKQLPSTAGPRMYGSRTDNDFISTVNVASLTELLRLWKPESSIVAVPVTNALIVPHQQSKSPDHDLLKLAPALHRAACIHFEPCGMAVSANTRGGINVTNIAATIASTALQIIMLDPLWSSSTGSIWGCFSQQPPIRLSGSRIYFVQKGIVVWGNSTLLQPPHAEAAKYSASFAVRLRTCIQHANLDKSSFRRSAAAASASGNNSLAAYSTEKAATTLLPTTSSSTSSSNTSRLHIALMQRSYLNSPVARSAINGHDILSLLQAKYSGLATVSLHFTDQLSFLQVAHAFAAAHIVIMVDAASAWGVMLMPPGGVILHFVPSEQSAAALDSVITHAAGGSSLAGVSHTLMGDVGNASVRANRLMQAMPLSVAAPFVRVLTHVVKAPKLRPVRWELVSRLPEFESLTTTEIVELVTKHRCPPVVQARCQAIWLFQYSDLVLWPDTVLRMVEAGLKLVALDGITPVVSSRSNLGHRARSSRLRSAGGAQPDAAGAKVDRRKHSTRRRSSSREGRG